MVLSVKHRQWLFLRMTVLLMTLMIGVSWSVSSVMLHAKQAATSTITRAEGIARIVQSQFHSDYRLHALRQASHKLSVFSDVPLNHRYLPEITFAAKQGIISGYASGELYPNAALTVDETIELIDKVFSGRDLRRQHLYTRTAPTQLAATLGASPETSKSIFRMDFTFLLGKLKEVHARHHLPRIIRESKQHLQAYISQKEFAVSLPTLDIDDLTVQHPKDPFSEKGVLAVLKDGVGHLFAFPGMKGKVVIYGHSSSVPWDMSVFTKVFRRIHELHVGDPIYVTYNQQLFEYRVHHKQVIDANDTSYVEKHGIGEELILYTCWPLDSNDQRYVVYATPTRVW